MTETEYPLRFIDPSFRLEGIQTTFRRGTHHAKLPPGRRLSLQTQDGTETRIARVVLAQHYTDFDDIPEYYIERHHSTPNRETLIDNLYTIYGPKWEAEGITVIVFYAP